MKQTLLIVLFSFLIMAGRAQEVKDAPNSVTQPVGMTVEQFNLKLKTSNKPLLVNFTADWCVVCKRQKPVLDQILTELKGRLELIIIDMEANPAIATYFEVDGLPVSILYHDGVMVWNRVGFQDRTQILAQVNQFITKEEQK